MKKQLLILAICLGSIGIKAETFNVEAGGNQNVTPYYSPQLLTIEVGDTVIWDFVLGTHNVTTTNSPVDIASGNIESPGTFMYVFDVAGVYDYECTLFDHADTQFGTITVVTPNGIEANNLENSISIYPNPSVDELRIDFPTDMELESVAIFDIEGKTISNFTWNKSAIKVENLSVGLYILELTTSRGVIRKRIQIER